ncbi:MAG: hypothetical protein ACRCTF_09510 [Bacteroidales bacterium]
MKNRLIRQILFVVLLLCQFHMKLSANEREILVINSYSPDFDWSVSAIQGIRSKVLENFPMAEFKVRYLNSEMFPDMNEWLDYIPKKIYRTEKDDPLAIVIVSDEAWLAYQLYYSKQFEGVPIFLCFVKPETICLDNFTENRDVKDYVVYPTSEIMKRYPSTAVMREINLEGTVDLMNRVVKDMDRIVLLGDRRYYASYVRYLLDRESKEHNWNYQIDNIVVGDLSKDSLLSQLGELPSSTGVLLSMWQDGSHSYTYTRDNTYRKMSDNLNVPIFLTVDLGLSTGNFLGGVFLDPYFFGEKTGGQIVKYLRGLSIHSIDIETYTGKVPQVNWEVAKGFGVKMEEFPDDTYFRFTPKRLADKISGEILFIIIAILTILLLGICILLIKRRCRKEIIGLKNAYDNKILELSCAEAKIAEQIIYRQERELDRDIFLANFEVETNRAISNIYSNFEWLEDVDFNQEQKHKLKLIDSAISQIDDVANEVIELIRMDSSPVELDICNVALSSICQEIIDDLAKRCRKGVKLSFLNLDPLFSVRGDQKMLRRMINSLVAHSIRICNSGEVVLSCRRGGENVFIELKYQGDFQTELTEDVRPMRFGDLLEEQLSVGLAVLYTKVVAKHIKAAVSIGDKDSGSDVYTIVIPVDYDALV